MFQDDDGRLNGSRITALLPYDSYLWIGTGDGNLLIYHVAHSKKPKSKLKTSQSEVANSKPGQSGNGTCQKSPEKTRADQSEERKHKSGTVDLEAVLKKVAEIQKEREKPGTGGVGLHNTSSKAENITLSGGSKETNTSTETLTTKVLSGSDSPRKSPRVLKKQHSIDLGGGSMPPQPFCNGDIHHKDKVKLAGTSTSASDKEENRSDGKAPLPHALRAANAKQALEPVETLAVGKSMTSEMDPFESGLSPEARGTGKGQDQDKGHTSVFHFESVPGEKKEDNPLNVTLNSIKEVTSESPDSGRRGGALTSSKRWRSRRQRVPEVSIQDSSGSVDADSDTKYSRGSKESSPVAIPRSQKYQVPNNTPLNLVEQTSVTSLTPWDRSTSVEQGSNVSPNFHRRPSKRDKGRNKTPSRSPSAPGRVPSLQDTDYPYEMILQAKIKVADRPIRSLVKSR